MKWSARPGWVVGAILAIVALGSAAVGIWVSPVAFLLTIPSGVGAVILMTGLALIRGFASGYRGPGAQEMDDSERFLAEDPTLGLGTGDPARHESRLVPVSADLDQHPWNDPRNVDTYRRTTLVVVWVGVGLIALGVVWATVIANVHPETANVGPPILTVLGGMIALVCALLRWALRGAYGGAARRSEQRRSSRRRASPRR